MCGIFGYIGKDDLPVTLMAHKALCDLEYRGYDSWGIAVTTNKGDIFLRRAVGKVSEAPIEQFADVLGKMTIGHSRWATHGGVSEANAHPHLDTAGDIAVIHNGIIENHDALRAFLAQELGKQKEEIFRSETDSEVVPHLIALHMQKGASFEDAFVATGKLLKGRFAIVAMHKGDEVLLALRDGSPLVVGTSPEGNYLASDVPAFIDATRTVAYLLNRQYVRVSASDVSFFDFDTQKVMAPEWQTINWDKGSATKEGYPHFMLKEILEQPAVIDRASRQDDSEIEKFAKAIRGADRIFLLGCGTAAKVAKLGELYFLRTGGPLATMVSASEFAPYAAHATAKSLLFAVSQSGETADVLEALKAGSQSGAQIGALLNVVGSSIYREAAYKLMINAGPEIAVASTKAASAQIAVMMLIAYAVAGKSAEGKAVLRSAAEALLSYVDEHLIEQTKAIAQSLKDVSDIYIIGRGLHAPIALEASIKIQEVSYIHAEGFPGGELKHGPIALISPGTPVIAFVPNDETREDMESNVAELKARGAHVVGIGPIAHALFDEWIATPDLGDASTLASLIPMQLLAYHLAVLRGNDPDKPRNLAKSVTVK